MSLSTQSMLRGQQTSQIYINPKVTIFESLPSTDVFEFHQKLPFYTTTRLVEAPVTAGHLGVRHVWVKDESNRLNLPAYKILGASWATYRELENRFGPFQPWSSLDELKEQFKDIDITLVTATDGNHGRAVARMAKWLGLKAYILVPNDMVDARKAAIKEEGAQIEVIYGTYDDAVAQSARMAGNKCLVISDTAWEGYERVPGWVVEGYGTIFREVDEQLAALGGEQPHLVTVQMGVGSLASAVVRHYRSANHATHVVGVEPMLAACVLRSLEADELKEVPGPHTSIMAGLNCGKTSSLAWPFLRNGLSISVAVDDHFTEQAMRLLAQDGIVSGESGAAGLAGLLALLVDEKNKNKTVHQVLGIDHDSTVLVISTEGATDPESYDRIVSGPARTSNS